MPRNKKIRTPEELRDLEARLTKSLDKMIGMVALLRWRNKISVKIGWWRQRDGSPMKRVVELSKASIGPPAEEMNVLVRQYWIAMLHNKIGEVKAERKKEK
jgi:hypothetical protein